MPHSVGSETDTPRSPPPLTIVGIREMGDDKVPKLQKLHKARLVEAILTCMSRIDLLESKDGTNNEESKVRSELRELKKAVFVNAANGSVPDTQDTQDYLDRSDTGWDAIHKLAAEQNGPPVTPSADAPTVTDADAPPLVEAPPVGENGTGENDKTKLAMRVKLARSTALWCLSPFTPVTQEAMDKTRKVCPVNLQGEVCTASNCGNKHPKVCLVADHGKGKIPKVTCLLWHMRVPFAGNAGNVTGRRNGSNLPPGSKGSNGNKAKVQLAKPDMNLVKLEATAKAEELKARIRAAKMMSQGISYSQVVQAQTPVHVAPAPTMAPAPAPGPGPSAAHCLDCSYSGPSDCYILEN
jgi:hypothetical protein